MSHHTVDDLHAAEDYGGTVRAQLAELQAAVTAAVAAYRDPDGGTRLGPLMDALEATAGRIGDPGVFTRPSCDAGECEEDCGGLAHLEGQPRWWAVTYAIRAGVDGGNSVAVDRVKVYAGSAREARELGVEKVRTEDHRYDERIDPRVDVLGLEDDVSSECEDGCSLAVTHDGPCR